MLNDAKSIFLNLLSKHNIYVKDIHDHIIEDFPVLIGFYFYDLMEIVRTGNLEKIKNHISFIEDLIKTDNKEILQLLEIDLFVNIYSELGTDNIIVPLLNENSQKMYLEAIKKWVDDFNSKESQ